MKNIIDKIQKSGIIEALFFCLNMFWIKISSRVRVFFLTLRGFQIHPSVLIGMHTTFFQSRSKSITLRENARIGIGVRIKVGFSGKITIGELVLIDDYCFITAHEKIQIGKGTMVAANVYIVDFNHRYPLTEYRAYDDKEEGYTTKPVIIEDYVWVGANSVILPGVTIGKGSVVGAGSIVTKSIPPYSIAFGNPAKVIRKINSK